jgi:hypothetical protein
MGRVSPQVRNLFFLALFYYFSARRLTSARLAFLDLLVI